MLNKPSLTSQLCVHSVCCILTTAMLLVAVTGFVLRVSNEERRFESSTAYARKQVDNADNLIFQTVQQELAFNASRIEGFRALHALQYETNRLRRQSDMFSSVLVLSPGRRVVIASQLNFIPSGISLNVAPEQLKVVKKRSFISDPLTSYAGKYLVFLSNPIYTPTGEYLSYLAGSTYPKKIF